MRLFAITVAAFFAALASAPSVASAECGGGGGGSGGSGGGGGGGGEGGASQQCLEVSPVVGYATCRRFGEWDASNRPPISVTVGSSFHRLAPGSIDLAASADHPDMAGPATFRVVSEDDSAAFAGGTFDIQIAYALGRNAYAGIEGQLGSLTSSSLSATASDKALTVNPTSVLYAGAAAVGGVKLALGDWDVRAEVAAGVELFAVTTETSHADCELSETSSEAALTVRPRGIVQRWLSPWISVGAGLGSNLMRRGDASASLFIGGHLRAFDGAR